MIIIYFDSELDCFNLSCENFQMRINELKIERISNMEFPYCIIGVGGASLKVNAQQLAQFLSEWLRMNLSESLSFESVQSNFKFLLEYNERE